MSIWVLLTFALCMAMGVTSFGPQSLSANASLPGFVVSLAVFLANLLVRGVRRPVV